MQSLCSTYLLEFGSLRLGQLSINRKLFEKGQLLAIGFVFLIVMAGMYLQYLLPSFRLEMFTQTIGLLFVMLMVQKPEEKTDANTGFGKKNAYIMDVEQAVYNKKPICIILINIMNYKSLRDILGYASVGVLTRIVAEKIKNKTKNILPKADPYYL